MSIRVIAPGLQATLQGSLRAGYRHMGMPWAGPADSLSMALANRLVRNAPDATALEITYGGIEFEVEAPTQIGVTGAPVSIELNGQQAPMHRTLDLAVGDRLTLGMATFGMRIYLAVAGGFKASAVLGSESTYLPAGLGGYQGRSLKAGDTLECKSAPSPMNTIETPKDLRPHIGASAALRAFAGPESDLLNAESAKAIYTETWQAAAQITRMGIGLEGPHLATRSDGKMKSAPVFPGSVQCPESGQPIILMADAQTTGGYPRIAQVAQCDLHLLGQVRPSSHIHFIARTAPQAHDDYVAKATLFRDWLPGFSL